MTDEEWTEKTGHVQEQCHRYPGGCGDCVCCNLSVCSVCGGLEGSLLPKCPGYRLSYEEDQANYRHYCDRTGPFAESGT